MRALRPSAFVVGVVSAGPCIAQLDWAAANPASRPAARHEAALAVDPVGGGLILFGGSSNGGELADTWRWANGTWTPVGAGVAPPARYGPRLAADVARGRIVLFGGMDALLATMNDTWEWTGSAWVQRMPATSPPARVGHAMTWDSVRQHTLVFGGSNRPPSADLADLWSWDGTQWQIQPSAPQAISGHDMVFDGSRGVAVAASGYGSALEWDGTSWRALLQAPPGYGGRLAYDAARQRVVWYGGGSANGNPLPIGVLDLVNGSWVQRPTATAPPLRIWHMLAYDPATEQVVLFGGRDDTQPTASIRKDDTWRLAATMPATVRSFGAGCTGSGGVPRLQSAHAWLGAPFRIDATQLPPAGGLVSFLLGGSTTTFGALFLPFSLAPLGMTGCRLLVSIDAVYTVGTAGPSAAAAFDVPANTALLGATFHLQSFVFDPAANPGGATTTNALTLQIGSR